MHQSKFYLQLEHYGSDSMHCNNYLVNNASLLRCSLIVGCCFENLVNYHADLVNLRALGSVATCHMHLQVLRGRVGVNMSLRQYAARVLVCVSNLLYFTACMWAWTDMTHCALRFGSRDAVAGKGKLVHGYRTHALSWHGTWSCTPAW